MSKRLLILGTTKNCGRTILEEFERFEGVFSDFDRAYFLVESDSSDDSVVKLNQLSEKYDYFSFISVGELSKLIPIRIERIAHCRNIYLEHFEKSNKETLFDFVAVVDLDNVNSKLSKKSIESVFKFTAWSACAANQTGPYYDIYALRAKGWSGHDLNLELSSSISKYRGAAGVFRRAVIAKMCHSRGDSPISVESAFGGFVLYRAENLLGHRYSAFDANGNLQCEHVGLHESMRMAGAEIFIVPHFINAGWTKNAKRAFMKYFLLIILGRFYYKFRPEFVS